MSTDANRRPPESSGSPDEESVFGRWSRLKVDARRRGRSASAPAESAAAPAVPLDAPAHARTQGVAGTPPAPVLPDLAALDENSDYSAFLTEGVDADLRRRALRQLFGSPKFNVCDGLDTYIDDYTTFPSLGDVVTADMRHHVERLARRSLEESLPGEDASSGRQAPSVAPAAASVDPVAVAGPTPRADPTLPGDPALPPSSIEAAPSNARGAG